MTLKSFGVKSHKITLTSPKNIKKSHKVSIKSPSNHHAINIKSHRCDIMAGYPFWARTTMSCWRLSAWQCLRNAMEDVQLCLGEATVWDTFWGGFKMCILNVVSGSFIWFYVFFMLCGFMMFYVVLCCFMMFLCGFMWFLCCFMWFHLQISKGIVMLNKKHRVSQHWSLWYAEMHSVSIA